MILGFGSVPQFVVSVLGYIVPSSMYFYFSKAGNKKEIKIVLVSIIICGLISGLYFAYDSYSMLILGKINDFSLQIVNYIKSRASTENVNISRGLKGYRSHGLLTSHSASAAWIAFSCFALLTLIPKKNTNQIHNYFILRCNISYLSKFYLNNFFCYRNIFSLNLMC